MGQKTNTIEINGKRYDAHTGGLLSAPAGQPAHSAPAKRVHDVQRPPAHPARRHAPQKSHTLLRQAVKKPSHARTAKAIGHTDALAKKSLPEVIVKKPARSLDPGRARRAHASGKSQLITHFAPPAVSPSQSYQAPSLNTGSLSMPQIAPSKAPKSGKPKTTGDMLDLAIRHATSHEQPRLKPVRSRRGHKLRTAGISAAALLLLAFAGWQKLPDFQLKLASAKAGFSVSRPGYLPAGYSLADLKYAEGAAALSFHSNSDDRRYTLSQHTSGWDSQALAGNFVSRQDPTYQTVQSGGRIIYVYGNGNATWISNGVWYVLQSDGSLSRQDLISLAASI